MEINLPWPPKELSPNSRVHWAVKSKKAKSYKQQCFALAKNENIEINKSKRNDIFLYFYPPDKRHRDGDNMLSMMKSGIDGVAYALGVNDKNFIFHPILLDSVVKNGLVKITFQEVK